MKQKVFSFILAAVLLVCALPLLAPRTTQAATIYAWPVDPSIAVNQEFTSSDPNNGHSGLDIACGEGTPIYSPVNGTLRYYYVVKNGQISSYGNEAEITTGNHVLRFAHLSSFAFGVDTPMGNAKTGISGGDKKAVGGAISVSAGTVIGYTGHSGNTRGTTGNHLHLEIVVNGTRENPRNWFDRSRFARDLIPDPTSPPPDPTNPPADDTDRYLFHELVFNVDFYRAANYYDLGSMTDDQLRQHWKNNGVYEGRRSSAVFKVSDYVGLYPDLTNAYSNDYPGAVAHFVNNGVNEGRAGCGEFQFDKYKANYGDLQTAFENNNYDYYKHYIVFGRNEGRIANRRLVLNYDACGGTVSPASRQITTLTAYGSLPTPSRSGYTFAGWYTSEVGGTQITASSTIPSEPFSDRTIYAHWTPKVFKITYDAGEGVNAPATQTKEYGTAITLSTQKPTRTGYTFQGWAASEGSSTVAYAPGDTYSTDADLHLFAVWKIITYTVTYDADGSTQIKYHGIDLTLRSITPTRSGYSFQGWATVKGSAVVSYHPGDTYRQDMNITLYEVWKRNEFTVHYDLNGGDGAAPADQKKIMDQPLTLSSAVPTRTNYTFLGWSASPTATAAQYQPSDQYTANADVTLYAVWRGVPVTVTYQINHGTGAPASAVVYYGGTYGPLPRPTRQGYTFNSWMDINARFIQDNTVVTTTENHTLYALWDEIIYTIHYDANNGTDAPADTQKMGDETAWLSSKRPTRSGYTFLGWASSKTAAIAEYQPGGEYTLFQDITLYAVWQRNSFAITYHYNDGTGRKLTQSWYEGDTVRIIGNEPEREGYSFLGWASSASAAAAAYHAGDLYSSDASINLYAVWQVIRFTVSYDANNGYNAPQAQEKTYGVSIRLSENAPQRYGYDFAGWALSADATAAQYAAGATFAANQDTVLYAVWQRIYYTVTFDANGGMGAPAPQAKEIDKTIYLTTDHPTRSGYRFVGWSPDKNADAPAYYAGSRYYKNESVTLYAFWAAESVPVEKITLNIRSLDLREKAKYQLTATVTPANATDQRVTWSSSNASIAEVDQTGLVTGISMGSCAILASDTTGDVVAYCFIYVQPQPATLRLPAELTQIEANAFQDDQALVIVVMNDKLKAIGSGAFRNCRNLEEAWIPASVTQIAADAFAGCDKLTIHCAKNSIAWYYAQSYEIPCVTDN